MGMDSLSLYIIVYKTSTNNRINYQLYETYKKNKMFKLQRIVKKKNQICNYTLHKHE